MQRIAQSMEQDQQRAGSRKAESMPSMGRKKVGEASPHSSLQPREEEAESRFPRISRNFLAGIEDTNQYAQRAMSMERTDHGGQRLTQLSRMSTSPESCPPRTTLLLPEERGRLGMSPQPSYPFWERLLMPRTWKTSGHRNQAGGRPDGSQSRRGPKSGVCPWGDHTPSLSTHTHRRMSGWAGLPAPSERCQGPEQRRHGVGSRRPRPPEGARTEGRPLGDQPHCSGAGDLRALLGQ